jgi:hypothetical protein
LRKNKPEEEDKQGLLSLIIFAGLAAGKEEYFKSQIIQHQYLSQTATTAKGLNWIYELQHNLSDLLFETTVNDVSEKKLLNCTKSSRLTKPSIFSRALVSWRMSENVIVLTRKV